MTTQNGYISLLRLNRKMIRKKESVEWCNYICTSQRLTQYTSVWSFEGVSSRKFNLLILRHSNKVNVNFCSLNVKSWNYSRNNHYAKFGYCSWQRISHVPLFFLWKKCLYIELYWLSNGICWTDRQLSKERIMEHEKSVVRSTFHNAYADHLGTLDINLTITSRFYIQKTKVHFLLCWNVSK